MLSGLLDPSLLGVFVCFCLGGSNPMNKTMSSTAFHQLFVFLAISSLELILLFLHPVHVTSFPIKEATVDSLQLSFHHGRLSSRQLTLFYLEEIRRLNPLLRGVIEVNPDALHQADNADHERRTTPHSTTRSRLHGIPVLLKDNIATKDKLNTTAGSFALLGSVVPRDAGVVTRLRRAGAVVLGKASLSEWANFRFAGVHDGWCARSGQGKNPYNLSADACGSSSGSAISVAANLVAVSLGTETDGSILCPSSYNSVVGIKPTLGLTSRGGVIPITPRQDTVGPICRTVSDAVHVLDTIAGFDPHDFEATREASKYIPRGGYAQFLKLDGLKGKRIGIVRSPFSDSPPWVFKNHLKTMRKQGAVLVDRLNSPEIEEYLNSTENWEITAMLAEFKLSLNAYLQDLVSSPVRTLADVIAFNNEHKSLEKTREYGQQLFLIAQMTEGIDEGTKRALKNLAVLNRDGIEKVMGGKRLDAIVAAGFDIASILAIGGHPGISVPAGYDKDGVPFGICFGGLRGSEPALIEMAYAFEQATKIRKPPPI